MNNEQIANIINDKLTNIDEMAYKKLLNNNTFLCRYDMVNRILILSQYEEAYDVRTMEEWSKVKACIIDPNKYITTIVPIIDEKYIDKKDGYVIKDNDLNNKEMLKALELNIIERIYDIESISIVKAYDISNTTLKDQRLDLNITDEDLINAIKNNNVTLYNNIKDCSNVVDAISNYFMHNIEYKVEYDNILQDSIKYSIYSLLNTDYKFAYTDIKIDDLQDILSSIDMINFMLLDSLGDTRFKDAISNNLIRDKAKVILALLESYSIYKKLH